MTKPGAVTVGVLGVTEASVDGVPVDLGTPKQRGLLAALALGAGRPVSVGALEEMLWGDEPPAAVAASLQAYVSGLRRILEPGRAPRTPAQVVVTAVPGYALRLPGEAVDAVRFAAGATTVQRRYAQSAAESFDGALVTAMDDGTLASDRVLLEELLDTWRGEPYADLGDSTDAAAERVRLVELRLGCVLVLASIRLAQGEHSALAAELAALRHEHPLHEGLVMRQVVAEYRCGRQADALATVQRVRAELADELGVDPGPALQALELAVLRQDPALEWVPPRAGAAAPVGAPAAPAVGAAVDSGGSDVEAGDPRRWPLLGREAELEALGEGLRSAASGQTKVIQLIGEPGIGKTRLADETIRMARGSGFTVLIGRCSEDEGAPPLWPWRGVLSDLYASTSPEMWSEWVGPYRAQLADLAPPGSLGADPLPSTELMAGLEEQRFRTWDAVARVLHAATTTSPVLLVLDDLHWADASSLRLLRHLCQRDGDAALLVVVTRRPNPEPTGALAEALDAMARRHGVRFDLEGLPADDVGRLVLAASGTAPSEDLAAVIRVRTEGNPFFVIELARWRASRAKGSEDVPAAVSDVVERRVQQLPDVTQQTIRSAAVLGRTFDLAVLADVQAEDEDAVLDALDPALAAGVVVESTDRLGRFRFAHALVRDAVYANLSATRRARRHADAARALAQHPGEAAHHWLAAGPSHAGNAWRAASLAAEEAQRVFGHDEADRLLGAALQAQRDDPSATPEERYELLMRRADACRWSADVVGLDACLAEAVAISSTLGDYDRMAQAAVGAAAGSLWSVRDYGIVDATMMQVLDSVLRELPAGDGELRCRAMLAWANEAFYADEPQRREALIDEGLAMARRLDDPHLLLSALQTAYVARWRSRYAEHRCELADEAVSLAERLGDATAEAMVLALHAAVHQELGDVDVMRRDVARVREIAGPRRLAYPLLLTGWMSIPWLAMAGDFEAAEELFAESLALNSATTIRQGPEVVFGALLSMRYWQQRCEELLPQVEALKGSTLAVIGITHVFLLVELDRVDDARKAAQEMGLDASFPVPDDWLTVVTLYQLARIAVAFEDRDQCARVYGLMSPFSGRVVSACSAAALGSADAVLGLLAAGIGERGLAGHHADRAAQQYAQWGVPLASAELTRWRAAYSF